ncbi:SulP family inorganic anion transporter [Glycomyces sp. TRM65418]|uniref:SulP family inorganic anion transporter n=1 Tax=Glycomyces sp. TRM65418 TaxID=2867006 RepID=UPI001CE687BE|nr:SulP family inorganic anion transporter [Glycomyces sp. TRM65418]MCC3765140.1 SulP family inorganic anion transporter [Glycomyces sp. TRM65418]QZD54768.1 SulP family inorganic anion transporter [Glycomyces sp. TRM65418]
MPLAARSRAARLRFTLPRPIAPFLRTELLAGLLVALALIPEAIAFSIIAGVDPRVGLFASFIMACSIAFLGGRPAMISAATGAMALVVAPLVASHGVGYLIAATLLAGAVQLGVAFTGIVKLMRFIPRSVLTGFINALAILIFMAQLPHFVDEGWVVWTMVAVGLAIIWGLPYLTKAVPSPLIAIVALTAVTVAFGIAVPNVGDMGELPSGLPGLVLPDVPFNLDTLGVIAPYAIGLAAVGLLESLMTAKVVDDATDTGSNKTREAAGQGIGNILVGCFGGMAGCAMIGQTMINVKAGARSRLSTFSAGFFLLILIVVLGDLVARIPMAALVAVMVFVSAVTFDWHSILPRTLRKMPVSETITMVVTVAVTVATHNLAIGVLAGVIVAMVAFARKVAHLVEVTSVTDPDGSTEIYAVTGQLFFASSNDLVHFFDYDGDPDKVVIDLSDAHVWDASTVSALDAVEAKYAARGKKVEIVGLNRPSARLHGELTGTLSGGH